MDRTWDFSTITGSWAAEPIKIKGLYTKNCVPHMSHHSHLSISLLTAHPSSPLPGGSHIWRLACLCITPTVNFPNYIPSSSVSRKRGAVPVPSYMPTACPASNFPSGLAATKFSLPFLLSENYWSLSPLPDHCFKQDLWQHKRPRRLLSFAIY